MAPEVSRIELLVHPFWFLDRHKTGDKDQSLKKNEALFLKKWSGIWGMLVNQVKNNPKSILVMTDMRFSRPGLEKEFKKFAAFAQKSLGNRLVMVSENVYLGWKTPDISKVLASPYFKLAKKLEVFARGEYSMPKRCVRRVSAELSQNLEKFGFKPSLQVVERESLDSIERAAEQLHFIQPWRRRKIQQRVKRKRLVFKQRSRRV